MPTLSPDYALTRLQAPMMMSAVACIIGNLAYCLSYDAKSLALLVIARLITGFGACSSTFLDCSRALLSVEVL